MKLSFEDVDKLLNYIKNNDLKGEAFVSFTENAIYTGKDAKERRINANKPDPSEYL